MPKANKPDQFFDSPTFVGVFTDGETVRMTTYCSSGDLDLERGKKLARFAYESRTGKTPPAFAEARFERANTGAVIATYSAIDLDEDEREAQS
jgi:hypothetical protein